MPRTRAGPPAAAVGSSLVDLAHQTLRSGGPEEAPLDRTALDDLVAAFRSRSLPKSEWTHAAHLRVGAWHVHHCGADEAMVRLRAGIRLLNERHGTPNTPSSGYHETITAAYVRLIDGFLAHFAPRVPLEHRVEGLVGGSLGERSLLLRFWSEDRLLSARARAGWVPPDLAPLAVPGEALPPGQCTGRAESP